MDGTIERPKVLILPRCSDVGTDINNDVGYLAYCNTLNKLGFVTVKGVSAEAVTSA
jgi:hypothetical protein